MNHNVEDPHDAPDIVPASEPESAPVKKSRKWWLVGGAAAVVVALGIGVAALTGVFTPEELVAEPAPIETVTPEPTPEPEPEPEPEPLPDPIVEIASVQHMAYSPVWNPPDHGEFFWQIVDPEYGYPEDGGTDYVLAHACETQACAGDQLRKLEEGDTLSYLGEMYQVQSKAEIMKVDIAEQDIWTHDPNRIVIITCIIETTWDQSDKNDVIIATRV